MALERCALNWVSHDGETTSICASGVGMRGESLPDSKELENPEETRVWKSFEMVVVSRPCYVSAA